MDNVKVFTPEWTVELMLQYGYYFDKYYPYGYIDIRRKHVMDNSCGDGAILTKIVTAYITMFFGTHGITEKYHAGAPDIADMDNVENVFRRVKNDKDYYRDLSDDEKHDLKTELETYIHGIEIDEDLHKRCIANLNMVAKNFGLEDVKWDVICCDALKCDKYDGKMDFVFANPPYKNIHNFGEDKEFLKSFSFITKGMADLYIVFFEKGFQMLSENGKMTYLTPSSWLTSMAGMNLRDYVYKNNLLTVVMDFNSLKVFDNATTFTMISVFSKIKANTNVIVYHRKNKDENTSWMVKPFEEWVSDGKFYFTLNKSGFETLKRVREHKYKTHVQVKNGFATLNDKLFIVDGSSWVQRYANIISCIKASKGEEHSIIFPYTPEGEPLPFESLGSMAKGILTSHAEKLGIDTTKDGWWLYGRTQAIKDVNKSRLSVNNLISTVDDLKLCYLRPGDGVYSGYYITSEKRNGIWQARGVIRDIIGYYDEDEFINYVKVIGKYKNGGYYTFSSKELQDYLNYKIEQIYET